MTNIINYAESELLSFDEKPFSAVDSLILAQLSYFKLGSMVGAPDDNRPALTIGSLLRAECFEALFNRVRAAEENKKLLFALAASPRFRDIGVNYFTESFSADEEKQFAAVSFFLPGGCAYLAFRGTDSSMVGWKEDFNMAFASPVPSQVAGAEYLARISALHNGKIITGGHSKGGNVAVYAALAASTEINERISAIYSHDGPGFLPEIIESERFQKIAPRIHKTLPHSSLIGMLLQQQENYDIVESDNFWVSQHDPFSWIVENGDFKYEEHISGGARYFNDTLNKWVLSFTGEQRELFVDTLFQILSSTSAETTGELSKSLLHNLPVVLGTIKNLDPETRRAVSQIVRELASLAAHNLISRRENDAK